MIRFWLLTIISLPLTSALTHCQSGTLREASLLNRRSFVGTAFVASLLQPNEAIAVVTDEYKKKIFQPGETLSRTAALERFQLARQSLRELLANYDSISEGGGDNVRRYLGTVGTTSGLYGIGKVLKDLQPFADDPVAYTEAMNDFSYFLSAAESAAYSAIFVVTSSSSTPPAKYFADAKRAAQKMQVLLDEMEQEIAND